MDTPPVILDPGSFTVKAGLRGDRPSADVPSLIARDRQIKGRPDYGRKSGTYIGHDATNKRSICQIRHPIEHGFVSDWNDYEILIRHTLCDKLRVNSEDHPLLITENPRNPKGNTEKIVQIAFENIGVPCLSVQNTSLLTLYAEKLDTGLVIELGHGAFTISPIYEGSLLRHISPRIPWSGSYITDLLRQQMLNDESAATSDQKDMLRSIMFFNTLTDIKHKCCFVSQDYGNDLQRSQEHAQSYEMPDGTDLKLSHERFNAPEAIFKPELLGLEMYGLPRQISDYLKRADDDVRRKLLSNVVISGGSSLFPGLPERFQRELELLTEQPVHVVASANRKYSAWVGGSRFASAPLDPKYWLSKEEYDEDGPTKIFKKIL